MLKRYLSFLLVLFLYSPFNHLYAQNEISDHPDYDSLTREIKKKRVKWVAAGHAAFYGGSITGLSIMWYSKQPQGAFRFFNDNDEWLQVDKVGHIYSAYEMSRASHAMWRWSGLPEKKSIWLGGLSGLAFQSIIEVLDGFSSEYGFSVGDYVANVAGTSIFMAQQFAWHEQRIKMKFSAFPKRYGSPELQGRADNLYGKSLPEKLLKDYNHQSYWLSFDVHSLFNSEKWPGWLNVAVGYGADGMFGGTSNVAKNKDGEIVFDRRDIARYRQWYLSPDINFRKIPTNKKGVKVLLFVLDAVKFPAPALEFSKGKFSVHPVFF